jgi:hypothetical protein
MIKVEMVLHGDLLTHLQSENRKRSESSMEITIKRILGEIAKLPTATNPAAFREGLSITMTRRILAEVWASNPRAFSDPEIGGKCGLSISEIVSGLASRGFGLTGPVVRYALARLASFGHAEQNGVRRPHHITSSAYVVTAAGVQFAIENDRTADEADRTVWSMVLADVRAGKVYS